LVCIKFFTTKNPVGIGFLVIKNQIESLNREITIDSEVGIGTTFTIKF